jgi:maltooligosyltrehalose trehalohydrolase
VLYRIWAPVVRSLEVAILEDNEVVRHVPLEKDEQGYHAGHDRAGRAGDLYKYKLDGGACFPDPASRWQPHGVHGPSMVIDPTRYGWQAPPFRRPAFRDLVIYELHIGTFTPAGTFLAAIERLPFLHDLGVSAIEIMPIADFAGERGWGYDGVCLYAPAHSYGHPDDLRALVDAAHAAGLAVILDVVYNHFGPAGNYLGAYIGDYLDEAEKTPWGGAIRYGHTEFRPLREFAVDNLVYWMEEFRVDGFRLDATHAILDESPCHLLAEMTECIHARGGYAIAEDARNERQMLAPVREGGLGFDAIWADDFHHSARVAMTREQEAYLADFTGELPELTETLRKGWYYCGQMSVFLGRPRGTEPEGVQPGGCICCISNHDQTGNRAFGERLSHLVSPEAYRAASALLCLTPHTPMLFMGQEWAASTPFLFFTDHEEQLGKLITAGRREEFKGFADFATEDSIKRIPDPQQRSTFEASQLNWAEVECAPHCGILELYRACLTLRRDHAPFRARNPVHWWTEAAEPGVGVLGFCSGESEWLLLFDLVGNHRGPLAGSRTSVADGTWSRILSTRESRFGGDGGSGLTERMESVQFDQPETVLLRRLS